MEGKLSEGKNRNIVNRGAGPSDTDREVGYSPSFKHTELIDAIFRVFPNASICSKSEYPPTKKQETQSERSAALDKPVKPRRAVLLACKSKVVDSRQTELFDDQDKETKPQNTPRVETQSEVNKTASSKPQIAYDIVAGRAIPYLVKIGVAHD